MRRLRLLWSIMRYTKADRVLLSYIAFVFIDAALIWVTEPTIARYADALWFCYAVLTTAGFGDFTATAVIPRVLSVFLSAYSIIAIAIITGVVVNYYMQVMARKDEETLEAFFEKLEDLPSLSNEELRDLSEKVVRFRGKGEGE